MAKIYVCDGCNKQFPKSNNLTELRISKGALNSHTYAEEKLFELCNDCLAKAEAALYNTLNTIKAENIDW